MIRISANLLIVLFGLTAMVRPDGFSYGDNQIFSHGYVDLENAGALSLIDYPFATTGKRLGFQTSYRQLYNIRELTDNRAGLAIARNDFIFGLALASFGEPDYFHQLGVSAVVSYHREKISVGTSLIYSRIAFNEAYDNLSTNTANIGAAYTDSNYTFFMVARAVNQPRYFAGDAPLPPEAEIGVSFRSNEGLDNQVKFLFVKDQKPTGELSQSFKLNHYASINWAMVLLPVRFGVGLQLVHDRYGFGYKYSHHPVLGSTHFILLSISS